MGTEASFWGAMLAGCQAEFREMGDPVPGKTERYREGLAAEKVEQPLGALKVDDSTEVRVMVA